MQHKTDIVLIGTGLAPLISAMGFLSHGKQVVILNPEKDYFSENSEFSLDPLNPVDSELTIEKILENKSADVLNKIKPFFPGIVEYSGLQNTKNKEMENFHDEMAPHVRERARIWVYQKQDLKQKEFFESLYIKCLDNQIKSQMLDSYQVLKFFPGHSGILTEDLSGFVIDDFCDYDVKRFRQGLYDFIQEKLGPDRFINDLSGIELSSKGIKYYSRTAEKRGWSSLMPNDGVYVFWTPKLTQWILKEIKNSNSKITKDDHLVLWENWSLVSRERLDHSIIGCFEDLIVRSEIDGHPGYDAHQNHYRLSVNRPVMKVKAEEYSSTDLDKRVASIESFEQISRLCKNVLNWEKFSIRSFDSQVVFKWHKNQIESYEKYPFPVFTIKGCEGPIPTVLKSVKQVLEMSL